ncbi:unnamed protein product [Clonostachys chloroleuca]|uniref:Uncharacterized protein n=1 Tax=Clonostachys chloroleuca TaxID=1926264 RepID=A0AA35Q0X5_9HYPO|nr:unnamed protein product [Clonostachys chloroleuca]
MVSVLSCSDTCTSNNDCRSGQLCYSGGKCRNECVGCLEDNDCPLGQACGKLKLRPDSPASDQVANASSTPAPTPPSPRLGSPKRDAEPHEPAIFSSQPYKHKTICCN